MSSNQGPSGGSARSTRRSRDVGSRRAEILDAAIERFGRHGYENSKWAEIADDVGIGPTALYHYFDSKQHCLYVILDQAVRDLHERFEAIISGLPDPRQALRAVCADCFELSERDVLRNRVLAAEQVLLGSEGGSQPEERSRQAGRDEVRSLEIAWTRFLAGAMEQGAIPERDPRMLARAMLGLYNSVWQWYRPDQTLRLPVIADFFVTRMLAVAGVPPESRANGSSG